MTKIISFILLAILSVSAFAKTANFSLKSKDGLATISGQIDTPECIPDGQDKSYPAVIIVGGTGLFTRDGYFGRSGTPRDNLFQDLSQRLNSACLATVRFDYRGVACVVRSKDDIDKCLDQKLLSAITVETKLDDIQAVYDYALTQSQIDSKKIYFIGHSEGSLNISRLVARHSISPAGLLFFGGVTESAKSILHWQLVGRPVEWAFEMDVNKDGILTNDEIKNGFATSKLKDTLTEQALLSPSGSWTVESLTAAFDQAYQAIAKAALDHNPKDPYVINGIIFSSYQWWQSWFTDDTLVLDQLKDFTGPIQYHNGDIDSQTPGIRELGILKNYSGKMKSSPAFKLHSGYGHGLSSDSLYGPIDEKIADQMVNEIQSWAKTN